MTGADQLEGARIHNTYARARLGPDVAAFLAWYELGGASETTVENAERSLAALCRLFPLTPMNEITDGQLGQLAKKWPPVGRRTRMSPVKQFFLWGVLSHRIERGKNPVDLLPDFKRRPQKQPEVFTDTEVEALLGLPIHDAAPLGLLFFAGLRRNEAIHVSSLRMFFEWANDLEDDDPDRLPSNPARKLRTPRAPDTERRAHPQETIRRLVVTQDNRLDRLAILLMYWCGLRRNELRAVDLFAGPGGWDEGLRSLGIAPLGIEWDDAACRTREAAGHATLQADIAELDPRDFAPCDLLLASPPCQAFSAAGKGGGHKDARLIYACADRLAEGIDDREGCRDELVDPRSILAVEPLRWALELRPRLLAWEEVPAVLPFWERCAGILSRFGYSTWTGILSAEQYGVPQTRQRAILVAAQGKRVTPPAPTHQRYIPRPRESGAPTLFDPGERGRIVSPGEEHLLPWVSMAEALGWGMTERPTVTIAAGSNRTGAPAPLDGGSGARATLQREREREARGFRRTRGRGMSERHGERPDIPDTEPAPTITGKTRSARWYDRRQLQGKTRERVRLIPEDEPAPTLSSQGLAKGRDRWLIERQANGGRRNGDEPALTMTSSMDNGNYRFTPEPQFEKGVRVTIEEAATLQGFPADYPWRGSRSKQFEQVGNAIPPPLARAIVEELLRDAG